jgi:hypothetical protein
MRLPLSRSTAARRLFVNCLGAAWSRNCPFAAIDIFQQFGKVYSTAKIIATDTG